MTYSADGFSPRRIEIQAGEAVRFVNASSAPFWPASHIHPTHAIYPEFDAKGPVPPGGAWTFTFDRAGFWRFHDHLDPVQGGLVVVADDGSEPSRAVIPPGIGLRQFPTTTQVSDSFAVDLLTNDSLLNEFVRLYGPGQGVAMVSRAAERRNLDCHQRAHRIGHIAYAYIGAAALAMAGHECHSGAYHGATEALFRDRGTRNLEGDIATLCLHATGRFYRHQCMHGIGHGLMAWTTYELRDALALCDQAGSARDRSSCHSGVFMENAVGGMQGSMGHRTAYLSRDPHFPCNAIAERYVASCYFYQTSHMLRLFDGSFESVARECSKLNGFARRLCFESMGRDAGGRTREDPRLSIALCSSAEASDRRHCLNGAVQDFFWDPRGAGTAAAFCRSLGDESAKRGCYATIIQRAKEILVNAGDRRRFCAMLEEPYSWRCR